MDIAGSHGVGNQAARSSANGGAAPSRITSSAPSCLPDQLDALAEPPWGTKPPPWAPGRREEREHVEQATGRRDEKTWCLSEVDIFCDLNDTEMAAIAESAPMKTYRTGSMLYSPHETNPTLFILKKGRVRIFRTSSDGRALTTAIITPGTIFGDMLALGQRMYGNYAEALDEAVVCVMNSSDVQRLLMGDPRIAARITAILGARLIEMEQRLCDSVFKTVSQRIATTLTTLAVDQRTGLFTSGQQIQLTHEQIAALAGSSRETTTKVLGEFAEEGLIKLARGKITLLKPDALRDTAGD